MTETNTGKYWVSAIILFLDTMIPQKSAISKYLLRFTANHLRPLQHSIWCFALAFDFTQCEDQQNISVSDSGNPKRGWKARSHGESIVKFKRKLKQLCKRSRSIDLASRINRINAVIRGWINDFVLGDMRKTIQRIGEHLRVQMIMNTWKQWKVPSKREWGLRTLGNQGLPCTRDILLYQGIYGRSA